MSFDSYFISAFADEDKSEPVFSGEITGGQTDYEFSFPFETKTLEVNLYYRDNGILSQPKTKTVDFENGERLVLSTDEITSSAQAILEYNVASERVLKISLNENQSGEYRLTGSDSLGVTLAEGRIRFTPSLKAMIIFSIMYQRKFFTTHIRRRYFCMRILTERPLTQAAL